MDQPSLHSEIARLRAEVSRLNAHRFIRVHNSWAHLIGFQFLRGLAFGLGTVVGASLLLSVVAWFLAQMDFVPILGDWAVIIAQEIETRFNRP